MQFIIARDIPRGPALENSLRSYVEGFLNEEKEKKTAEMTFCPHCHGHHPTAALASGWKCPQTRTEYDPRLLSS